MLSENDFQQWTNRLKLSEQARQIVEKIRTSEPVRKVKGSGRNVRGSYSSKKVGRTIQFESHTVELPALISFYDYDDDVLEYWDQPIQLSLKCSREGKKATTISHIPDFLVIRKNSVGFEEWKPEKTLIKRAEKYPYRYIQQEDGQWVDMLATEQAEKLGLYYRLRTDSEIDWIKYRNLKYLDKYLDGFLDQKYLVDSEITASISTIVTNYPGITITGLLEKADLATIDDINALIAAKTIYVDLTAVSLVQQEKVHIYRDEATAQAYLTASLNYSQPVNNSIGTIDIKIGSSFLLDGKSLTIEHIGDSKILLRGEHGLISWTHQELQQLISKGEITNFETEEGKNVSQFEDIAWEYFSSASPKDLAEANRRYSILEPYLKDSLSTQNSDTPKRTIRYWKSKYKQAEQEYGCGFLGLIPQNKGNNTSRYSEEDLAFVDQIIEEEYENFKQKNVWSVYEILKTKWQESHRISSVPSHIAFPKLVRYTKQTSGNERKKR